MGEELEILTFDEFMSRLSEAHPAHSPVPIPPAMLIAKEFPNGVIIKEKVED